LVRVDARVITGHLPFKTVRATFTAYSSSVDFYFHVVVISGYTSFSVDRLVLVTVAVEHL
jgi:hypothetical protein